MAKQNRKLTKEEKLAKKERQRLYQTVFINGKQKRIKRPTIHGMDADDFLAANADPIWLHQHGMWELIETEQEPPSSLPTLDDDIPF